MYLLETIPAVSFNGAKVQQFLKLASKKQKNFHLGVKVFL